MYFSGFRCCIVSWVHKISSSSWSLIIFLRRFFACFGIWYEYSLTLPVLQLRVRMMQSCDSMICQSFIFQSMNKSNSIGSNHSAGHLAILFQLLGKYFLDVIWSVTSVWVCVFVKVYVLEGGLIPLLCHSISSVCCFYVICCHQAKVFTIVCVGTVVAV